MKLVCTLLVVKDIKRSREFYENVLNCTVKFDFGENVTFDGDFAIHQEKHYEGLLGDNFKVNYKSNDVELYFESHDIEEDYKIIKAFDPEFVHGLKEQPWGQRVFRFYDPDFHIIEIGETMQAVVIRYLKSGMTIEETCKKTSMPLDIVAMIEATMN